MTCFTGFDGIEIRRVGRQIPEPGTHRFNRLANAPARCAWPNCPGSPDRPFVVSEPARPEPKPETFPHPWPHQRATEHKAPSGGVPQSECWSDGVPVEPGRRAVGRQATGRASGLSGCWLHSHPQTPDGPGNPLPQSLMPLALCSATSERFCSAACSIFYRSMPACASHRSMVEVGKGRSKRAPGSASVASGCAATNRCSRAFRAAVSNVLRLHKWVWGLSVSRSLNFCRTRRTAATQTPRNSEMQVQNLFSWPVAGSSPRRHLPGESTGKQLDSVISPSPCPT